MDMRAVEFENLEKGKEYFFHLGENKVRFTVLIVDVQQICVRMAWNEMAIFNNDNEKVFWQILE